jgi:hypothetical protein
VPYQPVPGSVALFARTTVSSTQNPRALHSKPRAATRFSYVTVMTSPMDSCRFNDSNRGTNPWYKGSASSHGSRQGSFSYPSFNPANQGFHPGYAARGPYTGNGDGQYGGRGRPAGRPPVHHLSFAAQRSQGTEGSEAQGIVGAVRQNTVSFASTGRQETVQQQPSKAIVQQGDSKVNNNNSSVGGSAASGALTVGA